MYCTRYSEKHIHGGHGHFGCTLVIEVIVLVHTIHTTSTLYIHVVRQ